MEHIHGSTTADPKRFKKELPCSRLTTLMLILKTCILHDITSEAKMAAINYNKCRKQFYYRKLGHKFIKHNITP